LRAAEKSSIQGYFLTPHGRSLMAALEPLQMWAHRWTADAFEDS